VALKNVTMGEPYFQGHFPAHPIMPGVLQLEAMAQVAGIMMIKQAESENQMAYFMAANSVKWRKPVVPGDVLIIEVELTKSRGKIGKARLQIRCENSGNLLNSVRSGYLDLAFAMGSKEQLKHARRSWSEDLVWSRAPDFTWERGDPVLRSVSTTSVHIGLPRRVEYTSVQNNTNLPSSYLQLIA
jgi:hypothetical protein